MKSDDFKNEIERQHKSVVDTLHKLIDEARNGDVDGDSDDDASSKPPVVDKIPDGFKLFRCENGKLYCGRSTACWFCRHLDDVVWDYANGPYMLHCDLDLDTEIGVTGSCGDFSYVKKDWEV